MQTRYFNHAIKALLTLSGALIFILLPVVHAKANESIVQSLNVTVFNKLWNQYCMDLGEQTLQNYFLTDDEIKKMSGGHSDWIPNQALRTGQIFLVSDNYSALGTKCYRNYNLHRVIIKKSSPYPIVITPSEIDKLPPSRSLYEFIYYAYKDFLTSHINNKIYSTIYLTRMEGVLPDNQRGVYFLFFNDSQKHKIAFKFDGLGNIYLYQLSRISKNTYNSKLIDKKGRSPDNISLPGPLQYKFTPKGLMTKIKGEKKFYFSDYINNKPAYLSPENDLSAQLVFIPRTKHQDKNIHELADTLSKSFNEFLGLPATAKGPYHVKRKKWLMNWINQSGYLTTEQGKKIKISNRKRLYTWLTRYLSKNHIKLIKGKTYYFSRSLSHYMIMDNYKINGRPILKTKPLNPCLFYKKYNKEICNY